MMFHDCLALGKSGSQNGGDYVTSDVQFAQQAREIIYDSFYDEDDSVVLDDLYMDITLRFVVDKEQSKVLAAQIKLDWGTTTLALLTDIQDGMNLLAELEDIEVLDDDSMKDLQARNDIEAQVHGFKDIDQLFHASSETISLYKKVITAFYYDEDSNFAGFEVYDLQSQMYENHTAEIAIDRWRQADPDSEIFVQNYENIRLVGLRTHKSEE